MYFSYFPEDLNIKSRAVTSLKSYLKNGNKFTDYKREKHIRIGLLATQCTPATTLFQKAIISNP